jgi:sialate O-acetylesterase
MATYDEQYRADRQALASLTAKGLMDGLMRGDFSQEQIIAFMSKEGAFAPQLPVGPMHPDRPAALYGNMLLKIAPYAVKVVIWYQGEADVNHAEAYAELFSALMGCWRKAFDNADLKFLFVQLAPFGR